MAEVAFIQEGLTVTVEEGTTVLAAMRLAGLKPDAPCGGNGKCGKCKVRLGSSGETVLACRTIVDKDMVVNTDLKEEHTQILTAGIEDEDFHIFRPAIRTITLTVPPCQLGRSDSDWTRFSETLTAFLKTEGIHTTLRPDPYISGRLPGQLKRNKGEIRVLLYDNEPLEVSAEEIPVYMAAFDIGTTTVAGYLINGTNGERAAVASRLNPQTQYGADVISRAGYSLEHGISEITDCIQKAIGEMVKEMADKAGCDSSQIYLVSIAGNTCMHHLYLGIDVDSLVHAPYNPAVQERMILDASKYQLPVHPMGRLLMLPNIAGFVGADTVACLVASDLADQDRWTLLIDIGTNGEMVLGKEHRMVACSTAAGPAFEGAGITHGMRGASGAISKVRWEKDHWNLSVIDNVPAIGICGSGLLDLAAELLRSGQMDEGGELDEMEMILVPAEKSGKGQDVTIRQQDIRVLQMAKAAICAGIHLLAESMEIQLEDIAQVWLAGAFGSFMDPDSACDIGMIPQELKGRIKAIGNAAGQGAQEVLTNAVKWDRAASLAQETQFIELACMPEFQDRFVECLEFPEFD